MTQIFTVLWIAKVLEINNRGEGVEIKLGWEIFPKLIIGGTIIRYGTVEGIRKIHRSLLVAWRKYSRSKPR